jgi:transposase
MISFPASVELMVVHTPVSFSCGIDGMRRYCQLILKQDPIDSGYFLFVNRRRDKVRVIWFDGQGFCLLTKRLSKGTFKNWPRHVDAVSSAATFFEAHALICGGNKSDCRYTPIWKTMT